MQVKTCPATVKTAGANEGVEEGVFEAIVAAYNVDSVGDRIVPGAFAKSLAEWKASGTPIPVLWSHKSDDPDYHIGEVLEAEERAEGLWVKARIDIDDPKSKSAKVYRLLKGRRVTQFSFAYDELDARPAVKDASGAVKDLHELKVYEVGPCLIGANQSTSLVDVKTAQQAIKEQGRSVDELAAAMPTKDAASPSLRGPSPVLRKGHGMTARDLRGALDRAVEHAFGGGNRYAWVRDYTDEWVVFTVSTEANFYIEPTLYQQGYIVSDGSVALSGQPVAVAERVVYAPVAPQSEAASSEVAAANAPSNAEKATPVEPAPAPAAQDVPSPAAKGDEPARHGTASERLRLDLELLELEVASHTI